MRPRERDLKRGDPDVEVEEQPFVFLEGIGVGTPEYLILAALVAAVMNLDERLRALEDRAAPPGP